MIRFISIILLLLILGLFILYLVKTKGKEFTIFFIGSICWFIFIPGKIIIKIVSYLIIFIIVKIYAMIKFKSNCCFKLFFGVPGTGKSTIAALIAELHLKLKKNVYSTTPILGCMEVPKEDIGIYEIRDGTLIMDECSTDFNNRKFKDMTLDQIEWFKKHRHYNVDIYCFSQYWNDIDIILRNLCTELYLIVPSIIPFFIKVRKICKRISIDKETKEIKDEYYFKPLGGFYYFAPKSWKLFKTHDRKELPKKNFRIYGEEAPGEEKVEELVLEEKNFKFNLR